MAVKVGQKFDGFVVKSTKLASALDDYCTLAQWFKESNEPSHQATCNQLYSWFCTADNKGTLAFQDMSQRNG
jgi:hypothetical protein